MKEIRWKKPVMGYELEMRCALLDDGIHVLLTGGSRTHVGAVSFCFPGEEVHTIQFPGHRDGVVSEKWAEDLCRSFSVPVVVNCGIHYNNVSREDIEYIVGETEQMLEQILEQILEQMRCCPSLLSMEGN